MHGLDAFVISTGKIVGGEDIFGIIIPNFKEAVIFSSFRFFRGDRLGNLNISFFILAHRYKINFSFIKFAHINGVPPAAQLQIHNVFKGGSHSITMIAQDTVTQRNIGKIKLLLGF